MLGSHDYPVHNVMQNATLRPSAKMKICTLPRLDPIHTKRHNHVDYSWTTSNPVYIQKHVVLVLKIKIWLLRL